MSFATTKIVKCALVLHIKLSHGVEKRYCSESQSYCQTYVSDTILWFSITETVWRVAIATLCRIEPFLLQQHTSIGTVLRRGQQTDRHIRRFVTIHSRFNLVQWLETDIKRHKHNFSRFVTIHIRFSLTANECKTVWTRLQPFYHNTLAWRQPDRRKLDVTIHTQLV